MPWPRRQILAHVVMMVSTELGKSQNFPGGKGVNSDTKGHGAN